MDTFYPTLSFGEVGKYAQDVERMLLPVSSWAGYKLRQQVRKGLSDDFIIGSIPTPTIPENVKEVAADCGGFVATKRWNGYRYSHQQYIEWLYGLVPKLSWAAMMDFCCENEITSGKPGIVMERQQATTEMAHFFWENYKDVPWVWVPTIQGWNLEDYERHALEMKPLIEEMQAYYGPESAFRVGIGTLCARASAKMIQQVVHHVASLLPGVPLHLWGVKLSVLQSSLMLPEQVTSIDSGAWNGMFRTGRELWKNSGLSQREYCLLVALPRYKNKIENALSQPKQPLLLGENS